MNSALSVEIAPDFFLQANLKGCSFGLFRWCFQECQVFLLFLLSVMHYGSHYKLLASVTARGQNTRSDSQQREAGETPEARRDGAAILRHRGVAPASGRVLAAYGLPPSFSASRCCSGLLPFCLTEL